MFNRKQETIDILKQECEALRKSLDRAYIDLTNYRTDLESLRNTLDEVLNLSDATPEDCKRGSWCAACEFGKPYICSYGGSIGQLRSTYFCGKAESCSNFIQKERGSTYEP